MYVNIKKEVLQKVKYDRNVLKILKGKEAKLIGTKCLVKHIIEGEM
jgi:hypothetical protein